MKHVVRCGVVGLLGFISTVTHATQFSAADYQLYPGDFNGDGRTDLLYIGKTPDKLNGIALADANGVPQVGFQSWSNVFLGLPWGTGQFVVAVGDFNGDGKSDVFLQSATAGTSYVLLANANVALGPVGQLVGINQAISQTAFGIEWSADKHRLLVGDFDGNGKDDVLLQATNKGGTNAIILTDNAGNLFIASTSNCWAGGPQQCWTDGEQGLLWSTQSSILYIGKFNYDSKSDILVQARPDFVMIPFDDLSIPVPVFRPLSFGIFLAQTPDAAGKIIRSPNQLWNQNDLGANWSPLVSNLVIGDFNGDGYSDVFRQAKSGGGGNVLIPSASNGTLGTATSVAANVASWTADSYNLIVGKFGNSSRAVLYLQATSAGGSNYYTSDITQPSVSTYASALQTGGAVPATPPAATAVGRTAGSYAVSPGGGATYTIPIWTPPGARGIEPRLALVYTSGAPDSLLGPGWSLSGLSNIARCALTKAQDGTPGPLTLTTSDKFCLDGNRLRSTGGTYGADSSTYQTEIDTFSKVTAHGVAGNGPQWFEVKGKDGLTYEYGNTTDSRVIATGSSTPYLWALNKVSDRQSNNLVITYVQSNGGFRPTSIQYTQTPATGATYHYQVAFDYILRATDTILRTYVGGSSVQQENLMSSVRALSDGALVRQYYLGYTTAPATQRGRLSTVQECTASNCLRPTTINYQDGQAGIASVTTAAGASGLVGMYDINGDGRMDLVYATVSGWSVKFATSTGFGAAVNAGVTATTNVVFDDFDADGSVDMLVPSGGVWFVLKWTGSAFTWTSTGASVDAHPQFVSADVNGDGLPDLVSYKNNIQSHLYYVYTRLNTTVGGSVSFAPTAVANVAWSRPIGRLWGNNSSTNSSVRRMDFDGDGRDDILMEDLGGDQPDNVIWLYSRNSGLVAGGSIVANAITVLPVNWNDDRCTDVLIDDVTRGSKILIAPCANQTSVVLTGVHALLAMDWDGDGRTDVLADSGGTLQAYRSTGNGVAAAVNTGIPTGNGTWQVFDQNGDGLDDLAFVDASAGVTYGLHNGGNTMPDLATSITDGYGMNVTFAYKSIAAWNSCYLRDSAPPAFPARAFVGPIHVACTLSASDGTGGTYQVSHSYYNSNLHLQGRGWLGFERRYAIDNRDGIVNMESYGQTFPYIGMTLYGLARQSNWTTKIREITNTPDSLSFGSGYDTRSFPYVRQSDDDVYEVGGSLDGQWIRRRTTTTVVDAFGNPGTVTASVIDKSTASPWFGDTYTTQTVNTITNDTANWCLGRPTQTTTTSTLPDNTSQTRTISATVDYVNCRHTQTVIEPASSTLKVTTTYGFDAGGCGNVTSVSVIGKNPDGTDMPARTTSANFATRCQFAESLTNALNQTTQRSFRYDLGRVSSVTDPNGIAVSWLYDGYGRRTQENRPDGTASAWSYGFCDSSNGYCGVGDLRWSRTEYDYDTTSAAIRYEYVFFDGFDRLRYDGGQNLAGALTWNAIIGYDARGNRAYRYYPFSGSNNGYTSFAYDLINRPIVSALYDSSGGWDRQSLIAYAGPAMTFTDPKGNVSAEYRDARGNLRRLQDPAPGGTTNYTWDPFSNLLTTTDPIGAVSSADYDVRGFRRASHDVDAGTWSYTPNSLGELVSQTDAKGQTTSFGYDPLGRITCRKELQPTGTWTCAQGTSTWIWGNSAALKHIGKLWTVSGPGYSESYTYDSVGRPQSVTYNADTTYQVDYAYNPATGYLDNVTYPTSTAGYRLRTQYLYTHGILSQVRDFNAPGTVWWQLNAEDARGHAINEQFQNGVHTLSDFDGMTGHLNGRMSGNNSGAYNNHQNLTFAWDKNENLDRRIDVNQSSLTERFFYDALDRFDYSTLNGVTNLDVDLDAAGNITGKHTPNEPLSPSDVGTYTYDPVKRHAVASTNNGSTSWSFTYDANGNMVTGRGATIGWYSYNLPNTITNGSLTSQFFYTPDGQYWRQDGSYAGGFENTIYIGGLLEKVSNATGTDYRHVIRAGTSKIIVSRNTNGTNETYYATEDHLASTAVVTKSNGTVVVSENFGAYGNRRGSNWQGSPSGSDLTGISSTTRRGFTGHTMVDNLTLTHMNGRMYDPIVGRFLSPDPIVQTLHVSQALNAYSYVWNNPAKLVDPSGFQSFDDPPPGPPRCCTYPPQPIPACVARDLFEALTLPCGGIGNRRPRYAPLGRIFQEQPGWSVRLAPIPGAPTVGRTVTAGPPPLHTQITSGRLVTLGPDGNPLIDDGTERENREVHKLVIPAEPGDNAVLSPQANCYPVLLCIVRLDEAKERLNPINDLLEAEKTAREVPGLSKLFRSLKNGVLIDFATERAIEQICMQANAQACEGPYKLITPTRAEMDEFYEKLNMVPIK